MKIKEIFGDLRFEGWLVWQKFSDFLFKLFKYFAIAIAIAIVWLIFVVILLCEFAEDLSQKFQKLFERKEEKL